MGEGYSIKAFFLKIKSIKDKIKYENLRNEGLYIKVTEEEREVVKKLAKCQCLDTSGFVRWLIFSKYIDDFIR